MHFRWASAALVLHIVLSAVCASPSANDRCIDRPSLNEVYEKRDGGEHHHDHHVAPLLQLNETEVTMYHAPTQPSYYTIDFEDEGYEKRHKGLMIFHGIFMCFAFFVSLPVGIALRSLNHAAHGLATASFYGFCTLGCAASGLYRKMSPNMYEGAAHRSQGYVILLVAISLSALDIIDAVRRSIKFMRSSDKSFKNFWRTVVKKEEVHLEAGSEYSGITTDEPEDFETAKMIRHSIDLQDVQPNDGTMDHSQTGQWANAVHQHRRHFSLVSEGTVFGSQSPDHSQDNFHVAKLRQASLTRSGRLYQICKGIFAVVERSLVIAGFAQLLMGIVTYTGGCRGNYVNGCLAHLIKGGIFWCYGLLTFARFLGSFADLGWAWNRPPSGEPYSAEFVESFVIFLYGATNTWMERFGANPGDPFTTKEIQHISIAVSIRELVMFCFAGLIGMAIESKRVRKWLAASTFPASRHPSDVPQKAIVEPVSYIGSYNPFPALVIGVTGAAMAAHAQTYLFQVQVHALWGNLLVAFSVLRCLTYFFLWLGPPRSILPSRPPTEALASFFLACGGLVFMFSDEEVTIAAMRRGRDDVMMFLNVAVAITCLACCWTLLVVGFKGWIKSRTHASVTYRNAA
ncbi:hypothetical protein GALMADRAFT_205521 [Galerina marginata CBS 339.88]|uniref:Protein YTP1-like C-terminal domain-containing protein n=1 Tax=Galerina marginata (strain CBS 339.88) TaxID=685588 RepID=A0A067TKA7_GALM3|nr:hypothetical protein GALMADRAFT_205521 [Galerina marginata CBS 339.88]